ncbi:MAG: putative DNA-binding domain-containing protein [Simkania sp.]|nr:putative DNA-binding domain-containing protein [Simkania sp.]
MSLASVTERFSRCCRSGKLDSSLRVDQERLKVYAELFRRSMMAVLERAFPLIYHHLQTNLWNEIVDAFLIHEDCSSPILWRMPQDFVLFIQKQRWEDRLNIPYLFDLAHFEWLEIEMFMMLDQPRPAVQRDGLILDGLLCLNPESRIVVYSYPVFEKKPLPRSMQKGSYPLLVFRDTENQGVRFIALSLFFKEVLEQIRDQNMSGREALIFTSRKFNLEEVKVLLAGENFLRDLLQQNAILGFKSQSEQHL